MEEQKSYALVDAQTYYFEESALYVALMHPNKIYQIEYLGEDAPEPFRLCRVVFYSNRCPSCGRYRGTTDPGMPDTKKQGGAEHICWKCAEIFHPFIRQVFYIDQIRKECDFVDERYYTRPRG